MEGFCYVLVDCVEYLCLLWCFKVGIEDVLLCCEGFVGDCFDVLCVWMLILVFVDFEFGCFI